MNLISATSLSDYFVGGVPIEELVWAFSRRASTCELFEHAGEISAYQRDELNFLALFKVLATRATWIEGDPTIVIRVRNIGTCHLFLQCKSGSMREVISKFTITASFEKFQEVTQKYLSTETLAPFQLSEMSSEEIILIAPRVYPKKPDEKENAPEAESSVSFKPVEEPTDASLRSTVREVPIPQPAKLPQEFLPASPSKGPPPLPRKRVNRAKAPAAEMPAQPDLAPPMPSDASGVPTVPRTPVAHKAVERRSADAAPPPEPTDRDVDEDWD